MAQYNVYMFSENPFESQTPIYLLDEDEILEVCSAYLRKIPMLQMAGRKIYIGKDLDIFRVFRVVDPTPFAGLEYQKSNPYLASNEFKVEEVSKGGAIEVTKEMLRRAQDSSIVADIPTTKRPSNAESNISKSNQIIDTNIFISHSSLDREIVEQFIEKILILGLNCKSELIFCTSYSGSDVKSGEDFRQIIKQKLRESKFVIQIVTENYKSSEVCLNEMGAAWVLSDKVIPFVGHPFNYDVGFIHSSSQQLKLNSKDDLIKFYNDHKSVLFTHDVNFAVFNKQIDSFLEYYQMYLVEKAEIQKGNRQNYTYDNSGTIQGILKSGVFGHPPIHGKLEDHISHHEYFYIELEKPINVLNTNSAIEEGDFNRSHFGVDRIQIAPSDFKLDFDFHFCLGKKISVSGNFMGANTGWHRTPVLLFFDKIELIN